MQWWHQGQWKFFEAVHEDKRWKSTQRLEVPTLPKAPMEEETARWSVLNKVLGAVVHHPKSQVTVV